MQIVIGECLRHLDAVMRLLSRDAERAQGSFACFDESQRSKRFYVCLKTLEHCASRYQRNLLLENDSQQSSEPRMSRPHRGLAVNLMNDCKVRVAFSQRLRRGRKILDRQTSRAIFGSSFQVTWKSCWGHVDRPQVQGERSLYPRKSITQLRGSSNREARSRHI